LFAQMFVKRPLVVMTALRRRALESFIQDFPGPSVRGDNGGWLIAPHGPLAAHKGRCVVQR